MDYEIIATLGPASADETTWSAMLSAGATAFRLNTSHLSLEQLHDWLKRLEPFLAAQLTRPPLVLDLQGSKWRLGQFQPFELADGQTIELVQAAAIDQPGVLPVPHADFFRAAEQSSGEIVLNDAKIHLNLISNGPERVQARVTRGGLISPHKGITFTASDYRSETLSDKDRAIIEQTRGSASGNAHIRYAISYVKDSAEMAHFRAEIEHYRSLAGPIYLIAKLERGQAMREAKQIAQFADELWVCRGDLGAELGLAEMAAAVHRLSQQVRQITRPVIMAGQVLEHMTTQPAPTRSEVCYVYDTLALGYHGFVLSDEAAIGRYPVESVRTAALFRTTPV